MDSVFMFKELAAKDLVDPSPGVPAHLKLCTKQQGTSPPHWFDSSNIKLAEKRKTDR